MAWSNLVFDWEQDNLQKILSDRGDEGRTRASNWFLFDLNRNYWRIEGVKSL